MGTILISSIWIAFLHCALLGEYSQNTPPYSIMGDPLLCTSLLGRYLQMGGKLQAYYLFDMLISNFHFSTLMTITTWRHLLKGYMKSFFWCKNMEIYITLHRGITHIYNGLVTSQRYVWQLLKISWFHLIPCGPSSTFVCWSTCFPMFALRLDQSCIFSFLFIIMMSLR